MVAERHNRWDIAGRLVKIAISRGSLGSCSVSTYVGSPDRHHMPYDTRSARSSEIQKDYVGSETTP